MADAQAVSLALGRQVAQLTVDKAVLDVEVEVAELRGREAASAVTDSGEAVAFGPDGPSAGAD